jgi:dihydrofolate reductase
MRLVITQNITLDGVIEAVDDWFSPQDSRGDTGDVTAELQTMMATEAALLVGRVTFESFRAYWPKQTEDKTGITDHLNRVPKYVVSSSLKEPLWENTRIVAKSPVEAVRELKAKSGGDLGVTGSITLCHALIEAGLVDEYRLFVYPVVLGRGRRLFRDGVRVDGLSLTKSKAFVSGLSLLTYQRR